MQTLQILDGADAFLRPLEGRPVVLGSGADVDVRLQADGVTGRHVRISFRGDAPWLEALDGAVRVNGQVVQRCALALGDRIEFGGAVVVLGRSVSRAARPDDVLSAPRSGRRRAVARGGSRLPIALGAVAVVVVAVLLWVGGGIALPDGFLELDRLRRAGSFELAQAQVDRLRDNWATDAERRVLLQREADRLDRIRALVTARREAILAEAQQRSYADFCSELQRDESRAGDEDVAIAARIVRASLTQLLRDAPPPPPPPGAERPQPDAGLAGRPTAPPPDPGPVAPPRSTPSASGPPPSPPAARPAEPSVTAQVPVPTSIAPPLQQDPTAAGVTVSSTDVDRAITDATALVARGEYRQAVDQLQFAAAGASAADCQRLQREVDALRRTARLQADQLLARARSEAAAGRLQSMIQELEPAVARFPSGLEFAGLATMLDELQRQLRGGNGGSADLAARAGLDDRGASVRRQTLAALAPQLVAARSQENEGDFAAALQTLQQAAAACADDPDYRARLQLRCDELTRLLRLHQRMAELAAGGNPPSLRLTDGAELPLRGVDGALLRLGPDGAERRVSWFEVSPDSVVALADLRDLGVDAALGAASMLYRLEAPAAAERVLQQLRKAEAAPKTAIDTVLAAGRGDPVDPRGYELRRDGFVAVARAEAEQAARKVLVRLDRVLRQKDPKVRRELVDDALALGPSALVAVVAAFRRALDVEAAGLEGSALRKQLERVAAQRRELDAARTFAKQLIFDEVKYFYPYSPPQVTPDKAAEYARVQQEVDQRVAAVRSLWDDDRFRVRVPSTLTDSLDRIDWLASVLSDLGELDPLALVGVEWARTLPVDETIGIRNYCATAAERAEYQEWRQVLAYNDGLRGKLDPGQREQLRITNEYRLMFGHRPVAADLKLCKAATGHAEEMSRLGYFSHFSPTPGRRTPGDRVKLAGYEGGASENIALVDSASSAHIAWCHSSGHHRNLLMPTHTELGIGGVGRYWVQNFGAGTGFRAALAGEPQPR